PREAVVGWLYKLREAPAVSAIQGVRSSNSNGILPGARCPALQRVSMCEAAPLPCVMTLVKRHYDAAMGYATRHYVSAME
ncbi:hypothetical protein HAX54_007183, partial [Datura stramonium]|nr:hypothetical protein [Datura stramonium]